MHYKAKTTRRAIVALSATIALAAGALASPSLGIAAPQAADIAGQSKIEPALAASLAQGSSEFWVRFSARADLSRAAAMMDRDARGQAVVDVLNQTADASQAAVRQYLDSQGVDYEAFWAVNAIHLASGSASLATKLASFAGVSSLTLSRAIHLIEPVSAPVVDQAGPATAEWGIQNIQADDVWSQFGDRGEGIVVASIDTGVQYNHPALVNQYRGKKATGGFNHNYNWFDAYGSSSAPFDSQSHGTHTMGTMVGDDGGANQIGVAPKARWIAANGCCGSEAGLVASGQWMLAPTKLNGARPKAKKRPHIVNNSWGYTDPGGQETLFDSIIAAWNASGIYGQWSEGNMGPGCNTGGAPGNRPQAYSAGAYDINNVIASFSSRGPGQGGDIKPNISAPGVNVRSSVPTSSYANFSGTSMASPHVAGAIALVWSISPTLNRNVAATKLALDNSSTDTAGVCGGTTDDNNTYGEGRLNALKLVQDALAAERGTSSLPTNAVAR
jgi:subtilisin family serine protease